MKFPYADQLKKYAPDATDAHGNAIAKHLGIALNGSDSAHVAASSESELETVREQWLKKKLKLTQPDDELDKAVADVCAVMKADNAKHRVVVYYLLAEKFGKLGNL
jgi:Protein of unknown function (DUF2853)